LFGRFFGKHFGRLADGISEDKIAGYFILFKEKKKDLSNGQRYYENAFA